MPGLLQALLCKHLMAGGGEGNIPTSTARRHGSLASAGWVSSQVGLGMVWEGVVAKLPHFPAMNTLARCRQLLTHRTRCWCLSAAAQHQGSSTSLAARLLKGGKKGHPTLHSSS